MAENFSKIDCQKVLSKYFNTKNIPEIIGFSLTPISAGINGLLGEHLFLKIRIRNNSTQELRFFAKALPIKQKGISDFIITGNMFNKEVQYYQFLDDVKKECPNFDLGFAPKYYFSRENEIIVLEDITATGYKLWSGSCELDLEHIKLSLSAIAKFHAASLVFEETKSEVLGRKYRLTEDYDEALQEALYVNMNKEGFCSFRYLRSSVNGLCALVDLLPQNALSAMEFKTKLHDLLKQVFEDIKPSKRFRNVWCHGDLWTNNLMFYYDKGTPTNCKIFDFQLQRYNPPAHDVLFLLYQTTDRNTLQQYLDYFLNYYYDALTKELEHSGFKIESILIKDEFYKSIEVVFPAVKLTKAVYKSLASIGLENLTEITRDPEIYSELMFNNRSDFIVNIFNSHKTYRNIMTGLLTDLENIFTRNSK